MTIYHILPEWEEFSAFSGGAVSSVVANLMRFDSTSIAVCRSADKTWDYGRDRILEISGMCTYTKIRARRFLPFWIYGPFFRHAFRPLLSRIESGDIVWCHSRPLFCVALSNLIRKKGARLVYHAHSSVAPYLVRSKFRLFTPDAVVFVSEAMRQEALRFLPRLKNTHVVYNGADEATFYPLSLGNAQDHAIPVILYVGRLHQEKGVHVLIEAVNILRERRIDMICKIVGSSYSGKSKQTPYADLLIKSSPSNVQFKGYCFGKDLAKEFREADVFCCPSIWQEPFGMVNIEAMASGTPVVAMRVGGIPEIASSGGVLLVEPNSPVKLADALQQLIENKKLRMKLGNEGYKAFLRRFTWSVIQQQIYKIAHSC